MQDRIKQMAVEAGLLEPRYGWATVPPSYRAALESFARLVAEDCARVCDSEPERLRGDGIHAADQAACAQAIRARYAETKEGK